SRRSTSISRSSWRSGAANEPVAQRARRARLPTELPARRSFSTNLPNLRQSRTPSYARRDRGAVKGLRAPSGTARNMILRIFGYLFGIGAVFFLLIAGAIAWYVSGLAEDLPDSEVLAKYEPPVMTRIHASDGQLVAEYAHERR